jgi:hypothetical protein
MLPAAASQTAQAYERKLKSRRGWGAAMRTSTGTGFEWQSKLPFYTKSVRQKLCEISQGFQFTIEPTILSAHEDLAALRWELQDALGSHNHYATRALTKLYFAYLRHGQALLEDEALLSKLFGELTSRFGSSATATISQDSQSSGSSLVVTDAGVVNPLMNQYHFLGYGRNDGYHLGMQSEHGNGLAAAATFSPWDLDHVTPILCQCGIKPSEVLVLSRLLSIPGTRRITLSQFIARLNQWVWREMPEIKRIVTYCNPNAGHYGTVYRGANFLPLCTENHPFVPFFDNEYISPRKFGELHDKYGPDKCRSILRASSIKPLPLLIYYYPIRLSTKDQRQISVGHCVHHYPIDL